MDAILNLYNKRPIAHIESNVELMYLFAITQQVRYLYLALHITIGSLSHSLFHSHITLSVYSVTGHRGLIGLRYKIYYAT